MIKYELIGNRIPEKDIIKIVDDYIRDYSRIHEKEEQYLIGKNTSILKEKIQSNDLNLPNWKVPIAYGRKIIKTVTGYMYKPGLITYQDMTDEIIDIFKFNEEPILNQNLGTYQGTNGIVYELHYIGTDEQVYNMAMIKASEGIAIYDHSIKPQLQAFIRYYKIEKKWIYEVYYSDMIIEYERKAESSLKNVIAVDNKLKMTNETTNVFGEVPIVVYRNNENNMSDISIVLDLIDLYDALVTDGGNEVSRFAWAYLLIFGLKLDEKKIEEIKKQRVMQGLPDKAKIEFLTRNIPNEFIETLANRVKKEIHRQSFIPDVEDIQFLGRTSGIAISKFIYLMEFIAADKQAYFQSALNKRFRLINKIQTNFNPNDIKINFQRNEPESDAINADIYVKLDGRGISRETLITKYTSIENAQEELEKYKAEQESGMRDIFGEEPNAQEESQSAE